MAEPTLNHPDLARLDAFGRGILDHDEMAEVESHLALCESCCQVLTTLPDDEFVGLLRTAQNPTDFATGRRGDASIAATPPSTLRRTRFRGSSVDSPAWLGSLHGCGDTWA